MFFRQPTPKNRKLEKQILDLESEIEALNRKLAVKDVEIESMAAVVARDRERIRAESSAYAKQVAEHEG